MSSILYLLRTYLLKTYAPPHILHSARIPQHVDVLSIYGNHSALMHFSGPAWLTVDSRDWHSRSPEIGFMRIMSARRSLGQVIEVLPLISGFPRAHAYMGNMFRTRTISTSELPAKEVSFHLRRVSDSPIFSHLAFSPTCRIAFKFRCINICNFHHY